MTEEEEADWLGIRWSQSLFAVFSFGIAEGAALYAVGANTSSTFLACLCLIPLLVLFFGFAYFHLARYVPADWWEDDDED